MKKLLLMLPLLFTACVAPPDTQPIVDSTLQWKKMEDEEIMRHKQLLSVAKFHEDPVKNAEAKAAYASALDRHQRIADQYAGALVSWAQRIGAFDPAYADQTLDKMIDIYLKLKAAEGGGN